MIVPSQCDGCVHLNPDARHTCAAFPQGIPREVLWGSRQDHRLPYPGDNGIRFTPEDERAAQKHEALFKRRPVSTSWERHVFPVTQAYVEAKEEEEGRPLQMRHDWYRYVVVDESLPLEEYNRRERVTDEQRQAEEKEDAETVDWARLARARKHFVTEAGRFTALLPRAGQSFRDAGVDRDALDALAGKAGWLKDDSPDPQEKAEAYQLGEFLWNWGVDAEWEDDYTFAPVHAEDGGLTPEQYRELRRLIESLVNRIAPEPASGT